MLKPAKVVLIVDSVEEAVKFYTDKLGFAIVNLKGVEGGNALGYAELHKGKSLIVVRVPHPEEVVDFSQIKYAPIRGGGMFLESKKGIERYFSRCKSKGVNISKPLQKDNSGFQTFTIKDPFGFLITFAEEIEGEVKSDVFMGMQIDRSKGEKQLTDEMIRHVRKFGLSQRAAKKFAKSWLKKYS